MLYCSALASSFTFANTTLRLPRDWSGRFLYQGPPIDQYDALTALVNWVETGEAPARIVAGARGPGNAGGVNADVPADWSPTRTRLLCPYPQVARYKGGDKEVESSFACER